MMNVSSTVFAAGEIDISADENIKPGKTFNTYLTVTSDESVGAVIIYLEYDDKSLTLSSAAPEEKSGGDYFRYSVSDGQVKLLFMTNGTKKKQTFKLRFKPFSSDTVEYDFYAYSVEAYTIDESEIESISPASVRIGVTQTSDSTASKTDKTTDTGDLPGADSSDHSTENSRKLPVKAETSRPHKQETEEDHSDSDGKADSGQQTSENEYYVHTQHDSSNAGSVDYKAMIGAAAAVAVGILVCLKQYRKLKK